MFTTNNGGAPGVNTPTEKGQGAYDPLTLETDTNGTNFRTDGAIQQVPDGTTFVTRLSAVFAHIKDAVSGFYLDRGVGIEAIATLILVAAFVTVRVMQ